MSISFVVRQVKVLKRKLNIKLMHKALSVEKHLTTLENETKSLIKVPLRTVVKTSLTYK